MIGLTHFSDADMIDDLTECCSALIPLAYQWYATINIYVTMNQRPRNSSAILWRHRKICGQILRLEIRIPKG